MRISVFASVSLAIACSRSWIIAGLSPVAMFLCDLM
jgi:hypothetical protein